MVSILWTEQEGRDEECRRVCKVSLELHCQCGTHPKCEGQVRSPSSPQGGLRTWADELVTPHKVEVAGICSVSLCPQHYTCEAGDGQDLWSLHDPTPKQP